MSPEMAGWQILTVAVFLGGEIAYGADRWLDHCWSRAVTEFRSRTPGGSTSAGNGVDPQHSLPARAGVERDVGEDVAAPPAHPLSGAAVHHPWTSAPGWSPPAPVDAGVSRGLAFTGLNSVGAGHPHLPPAPTELVPW